jgi:type IV pilus assembly protein PilA
MLVFSSGAPQLRVRISNPGPVPVRIDRIEVEGTDAALSPPTCYHISGPPVSGSPPNLAVGTQVECRGPLTGFSATPGTVLSGRVILGGGHSFPFNAVVKPYLS